jgi:methyl-accepting chemotaxis protein
MNPILERLVKSMEYYQDTYPEDACIIIADTGKIIGYLPGETFDLKVQIGDSIERFSSTVSYKALKEKIALREERGSEIFGFPYVSSARPILDENGEVIGVISAVVSNKRLDTLRSGAANLSAITQQVAATLEQLSEASGEIAHEVQKLAEESEKMLKDIHEIEKILSFVNDVASQSHLLGLNAAIEAARAGEHGRGFSVVAGEIRKMAESSKQAVRDIEQQMQRIIGENNEMNHAIQQIAANIEEHSASLQEISATFIQIEKTAEELSNASKL